MHDPVLTTLPRHALQLMSKGTSLQSTKGLLLENPMDRGAWQATVHWVTKELDMTWTKQQQI